ncbi:hypothetical protein tb265_27620 [Gemmatimonadetes bacterium T265]|nr:hypothetical protein tb265_27620 [Gemmatimonadetes bacterium T265]
MTPAPRPAYDSPTPVAAQGRRAPSFAAHVFLVIFLAAAPLHAAGSWLAAAAPLDTIVTKAAPLDPGWFERVSEALHALMTLALLALTIAVVPAAWNFRKSYQKVSDLLDRVYGDVAPITHHTSRIAENVDYVTTAVRSDVERVTALVARAERRIDETLMRAEARARDLEALLHVAQSEAEHSLVAAASTVAGVREGFASLRDDIAGFGRRAPNAESAAEDERGDGDDASGAGGPNATADTAPRPRIRTRDA